MTVRAKVATILNDHEIAVNAGSAQGVKVGDIATVVQRTRVVDPVSKEALGEVTSTIVRTRVTSVTEKFSVARTFELSNDIFGILTTGGSSDRIERISSSSGTSGAIHVWIGAEVDVVTPKPSTKQQT